MKKNRRSSDIFHRTSASIIKLAMLVIALLMTAGLLLPSQNGERQASMIAYAGEITAGDAAAVGAGEAAHEETGGLGEFEVSVTYYDGTIEAYYEQYPEKSQDVYTEASQYAMLSVYSEAGGSMDGSSSYGYEQLSAAQQSLYRAMAVTIDAFLKSGNSKDFSSADDSIGTAASSSALSSSDASKAFQCFLHDHPQYYWVGNRIPITVAQDSTTVTILIDSYYYAAATRQATDASIAAVSNEWITELSAIMNDGDATDDAEDTYEVALRLHDFIIERINYEYENNQPSARKYAHSIGGVFTGEGVVCEGYAKAFQYILNRLGIENVYIVGTSRGGGHAWNGVKIGESYYLVDVTWDDRNVDASGDVAAGIYDYFCAPEYLFNKSHTPFKENSAAWMYELPDFADNTDYVYYYKYESYVSGIHNSSTIEGVVTNALASARGDFVYFLVDSTNMLSLIYSKLGGGSYSYIGSIYGIVSIYQNIKITTAATDIALTNDSMVLDADGKNSLSLEVGASDTIQAVLQPTDSDDRIKWTIGDSRIAAITVLSDKVTVRGKVNGTTTLTATTVKGGVSAVCTIVVGTGEYSAAYTIWAGGGSEAKSVLVETEMKATNWQDARGRTKKGRLVWLAKSEQTQIVFDTVKHTVLTKSDKVYASVSSKGKVTAKKAGTAYVYVCDTGTLTYEEYEIKICQAPSKIYLSSVAQSIEKADLVKKESVPVGETSRIFIVPYFKNGTVDEAASYSVAFAKAEYAEYLSISEVMRDADNNLYFTVTGKNYLQAKLKPANVKLVITNTESKKKVSCTVMVGNPVVSVTAVATDVKLAEKRSTAAISFDALTAAGADSKTTDKLKVYVAKTAASINGKRVVFDRGATVKARYDKNSNQIVLTASKDAGVPATVYIAFTDAVTKELKLFQLVSVNEAGEISR